MFQVKELELISDCLRPTVVSETPFFNGGIERNVFYLKNIELMQFTGLKDKNGKEIYEGDIIQIDNAFGKIIGNYEVRWLEGKHGFDFWGFNKIAFGMSNSVIFKVIGNIKENPELLKNAK
jgi:uncharacterized phage protein (TIGR01671 family)